MSRTRLIAITVLGLLVGQGMASCSHSPGQQELSREPSRTLEAMTVTDLPDAVRVELTGTKALSYSLSTSLAPASATLDLPGVISGPAIQRLDVKTPPLVEIVPDHVTHPREGTRVVFKLSAASKPEIRAEGARLLLDFPKVRATIDEQVRPEADAVEVKASSPPEGHRPERVLQQSSAAGTAPATVMSKIEVRKQDKDALVVISGNGALGYEVVPLGDDRLVVDLPHVTSQLQFHVLPVNHPVLKQIRIGQHSDKVRLVFDLLKPAAHAIHARDEVLSVGLQALAVPGEVRTGRAPGADLQPGPARPEGQLAQLVSTGTSDSTAEAVAQRVRPRMAQMAPEARGTGSRGDIGAKQYVGRRISMDFQQADITNVLRLIADVSGFNIVIGEGVKAKVTLKLASVPWDQALDMILKMNNLGMIKQGNIVWIDTLANIARMQDEEAKAKESKEKAEELVTRVIYIQNVTATEIMTTLRQYLSPRGQLQVNAPSNSLVVKDTETQIAQFAELVRSLDLEVPQVNIEARIIQADTSYSRSLGVQWGFTSAQTNDQGRYFVFSNLKGPVNELSGADSDGTFANDFIVNLPATVSGLAAAPAFGFATGTLGSSTTDLDIRISAGELLGLTKVIAAPKISTLDKREAKIEQGESIPFQTTSLQGTQTTFVDANLTLQVTPQITSRDPKEAGKQILLKVRVTRNSVGARSNPAGPSIDKKEATTQVLVRDGETMVIGGIFIDQQRNNVSGMPWMDRIPVLGWLFKQKTEEVSKAELLIFLTPTITKA